LLIKEATKDNVSPKLLFELGRYLKQGRPSVPAQLKKAQGCFKRILALLNAIKKPTPEQCCLKVKVYQELLASPDKTKRQEEEWKYRMKEALGEAIKSNYAQALYLQAKQYISFTRSSGNSSKTLKWLEAAASGGDWDAKAFLGFLKAWRWQSGNSPTSNKATLAKEGLQEIKEGILHHSLAGQTALGILWIEGYPVLGGEKNEKKGRFWLERAAQRGDKDAIEYLKKH